jgi:hypothetical protein
LDDPTRTSDERHREAAGSNDLLTRPAEPAELRTDEPRPTVPWRQELMLQGLMGEPRGDLRWAAVALPPEQPGRREPPVTEMAQLLQEPTAGPHRQLGVC